MKIENEIDRESKKSMENQSTIEIENESSHEMQSRAWIEQRKEMHKLKIAR
jgi:hypothetical protein